MDGAEVARNNTEKSCWLVINSRVYNVTSYLDRHPGGAAILLNLGGHDATAQFRKIHSPDILGSLPSHSDLGPIDTNTMASLISDKPEDEFNDENDPRKPLIAHESAVLNLSQCVVVDDFERDAKATLSARSWAYVSSSSNSGLSQQANLESWSMIEYRPRVLRNVSTISTETSILGYRSSFPFFVAPMGLLGRAHDGAEAELARGLIQSGAHGVISTASTRPAEEIADAWRNGLQDRGGDQIVSIAPSQLHFQLYVPTDRATALRLIHRARSAGYRSLWVTVDAPFLGKRTVDRRFLAAEALKAGSEERAKAAGLGIQTHVPQGQMSSSLTWEDLAWIKKAWGGPVVVKGIQCAGDAQLALQHGCQGIVLSNHGGRQLHSAPDALKTLLEIREYYPDVPARLEVFVDGGLRDGADILKALCLGARAVGVGRPFFYALATYGSSGVQRCVDILSEELRTAMGLVGITSPDQASAAFVNSQPLKNSIWRPPKTML